MNNMNDTTPDYKLAYLKWFDKTKGFGFFTLKENGVEHFVHISVVKSSGLTELKESTPYYVRIGNGKDGRPLVDHIKE